METKKLTPEEIHELARRPLPMVNTVKWNYNTAGNKIYRESANRLSNENDSTDYSRY